MPRRSLQPSSEQPDQPTGREPALGGQNADLARTPALGGDAALLHALDALADESWQIRMRAVEALGQMSSQQALDSLARVLSGDGSPHVRERAADALGRLGSDEALGVLLGALKASGTPNPIAAAGLAYFPRPEAIEQLVAALADSRQDDWRRVVDALVRIGGLAAPWLVNALSDTNTFVASGALEALGRIGGQLEDKKERGHYFDAITPLIEHENYQVRNSAYLAIGRLRDARSLPLLTGTWSQNLASYYNRAAMQAVGEMGEMAIPTILDAMAGESQTGARNAAGALSFLPPHAMAPLVAKIVGLKAGSRRVVLSRIESLNNMAVAALRTLLDSDDQTTRATVATFLGTLEASSSQTAQVGLEVALRHADPLVRLRAATQLVHSWLHPERTADLIELAHDVDKHVRAAAIRALRWQTQGEQALIDALSDEFYGVRLEAVRALSSSQSVASAQALISVLRGPERALHNEAAESLRNKQGEDVITVLIEALGTSYTTATRRKAARSLAEKGSVRGVAPLAAAIADRNHNIRLAAAKALRMLIRRLRQQDYEAAIAALREELVTHPSEIVRLHAAYNLCCLGDPSGQSVLADVLRGDELMPYLNEQVVQDALDRIHG
jgi:HEAT repeat protein